MAGNEKDNSKAKGQRGPDKNPEQSRIARQNAAKKVQELRKKGGLGKDPKNAKNNSRKPGGPSGPGGPGSGPNPRSDNPGGPGSSTNRDPSGRNLGGGHQEERTTEDEASKIKWNSAHFEEALPTYLQQYVEFLDKIARWFTRDDQVTFKAWYEKLTEKEAKGDASLLAPVLKMQIPILIQKYPVFVFLYVFFKLTFTKIRWKVVDIAQLKDANPKNQEATDGGKHKSGKPPGETTETH